MAGANPSCQGLQKRSVTSGEFVFMHEYIQDVTLHETARERYLSYALSVITARALPDVRDGLKPVQRRILYAMAHGLHLTPDSKHRKSAAVVGEVMAKYHPHGDQSIYDAMVRLAQDFSLRYPLVSGQGNFGSLDGDKAAAMRYTEAKLTHIAEELLSELKKQTVDFRPNYDGTLFEPVVLPAQFPNLLVNGAAGIAVGMATDIPPHNLREVVAAAIALIDRPDLPLESIVGPYIKGPDFPTGGSILTELEELRKVYRTGQGSIELRGEYHLESEGQRRRIVVTSIPYGVNKANLIAEIAELIRVEKIPQLVDIRDESTESIRVVMELKRGAEAEAAMSYLFKRTALQSRIPVNMTALVPTDNPQVSKPHRLDLKALLQHFLVFRQDVTRRRLEYDLQQIKQRMHILRAFVIIFGGLDIAIALIRTSDGKSEARQRLMDRFGLDEQQAEAILETKLYRLARMEVEAIQQELVEKETAAREIESTLCCDQLMWALVKSELSNIAHAYGDRRRSQVTGPIEMAQYSEEEYIVEEDAVFMVTREGRIKRQKSYTDLASVRVKEGDELGWVMPATTRETAIIFTDRGQAYTLRLAEVSQTTGHGEPIQTRFDFGDGEHVVGVVTTDERCLPSTGQEVLDGIKPGDPVPSYALALSRSGRTLRFSLDAYREPSTVAGRRYMRLEEAIADDAVVGVVMTRGDEWVTLATRKSRCLVFPVSEVNVLSGPGKGVLAIKQDPDDYLLGFELTTTPTEGLEVETNRGRREVVRPDKYKVGRRGGRGKPILRRGHLVKALLKPTEIQVAHPASNGFQLTGEPTETPEPSGAEEEQKAQPEDHSNQDDIPQGWLFDPEN
ncbi:MAG: DNA topoisomerase IV subunit A [Bradymonadales bacterium]|nr:DNA topoisomerase IV subunit A [Bradymonadales bacterium]